MKIKLLETLLCGLLIGCMSAGAKGFMVGEVNPHRVMLDLYHGSIAPAMKTAIENGGFPIQKSDAPLTDEALESVGFLWIAVDSDRVFQPGEIKAVKSFVRNGGTVICSAQAWSWVGDKKDIKNFPLNQLGKELGFMITGLNIGKPVTKEPSVYLRGIESLVHTDWWPSMIEPQAQVFSVLIRDEGEKPMAIFIPSGKGRVFVFGHATLLTDNPQIVLNILTNK